MTNPTQDSQAIDMARQRLGRLEKFLQEDPNNQTLLADAFETALRCGEWTPAAFHLRHAQALGYNELVWGLRESDFWLAQQRWDEAQIVLEHLQTLNDVPVGFSYALIHNLAYIEFRRKAYAEAVQRMQAVLEETLDPAIPPELQQLWLRSLHQLGHLQRASRWAEAREQAGLLDSQAAGVASLIALDAANLAVARRWSDQALATNAHRPRLIEALITQASLALADRDSVKARQLADEALRVNPMDGRSWSVRAFADMLEGELTTARAHFARALDTMPQHIGTWHGQGWAQILLHDLDAAQISFETALALDRNFAESHGGLAVVLALKQQKQEAQMYLERALRLDKSNFSGRYAQAILSGEVQDVDSLRRFAQKLLGTRAAPLGGLMSDWLYPTPPSSAQ